MSPKMMKRPNLPTLSTSNTASSSIEALLGSITDIVRYNVQKTRYECSLALQEQLRKLREADFQAEARTNLELNKLLATCKAKLECIKIEIAAYPNITQDAWNPLVDELQARIKELSKKRKLLGKL